MFRRRESLIGHNSFCIIICQYIAYLLINTSDNPLALKYDAFCKTTTGFAGLFTTHTLWAWVTGWSSPVPTEKLPYYEADWW